MIRERVYEAAIRLAVPALRIVAPFHERLQRGVAGRSAAMMTLREFSAGARDSSRPLIWLHAPSVGEALMAQAILAALKREEPRLQSAFTFFSPSAERMAARVGADWSGYLPWDRATDVRAALDALNPDCIVFVRTEIWPVLVREAVQRGVPALMANAVLSNESSRLGGVARSLLSPSYRRLSAVGVVSANDAHNFPRLGVPPERIHITGDARFDQVVERVAAIDRERPLLRQFSPGTRLCLVAGSTWPVDEELLVTAFAARRGVWRAIVAPHEPTPDHVQRLERALSAVQLRHLRLPQEQDGRRIDNDIDVIVVDRVGVLADLYAVADAAYVGGGFGAAGLHSVVEPAALGVPVVYGPRHGNAGEAARLARAGGGFVVQNGLELQERLARLAADPAERSAAGAAARAFVMSGTGGAEQSARLIRRALHSNAR